MLPCVLLILTEPLIEVMVPLLPTPVVPPPLLVFKEVAGEPPASTAGAASAFPDISKAETAVATSVLWSTIFFIFFIFFFKVEDKMPLPASYKTISFLMDTQPAPACMRNTLVATPPSSTAMFWRSVPMFFNSGNWRAATVAQVSLQ